MPSALRSALVLSFTSALIVLSMPGCSQQGEGERCDSVKNGNDDCDSGLTCVPEGSLLDKTADRCCPAQGTETDKRCTRMAAGTGTGGTGTGTGGTDASGGTSGGGTSASGGTDSAGTGGSSTDASGADAGGNAGATGG